MSRLGLFGYGSLVLPESAAMTLGRPVGELRPARLHDWRRRFSQRRTREPNGGSISGEQTCRPGATSRIPPDRAVIAQWRSRLRTRPASATPGLRTPVFSTNTTRLPAAARRDASSWCACHSGPQSTLEITTTSRLVTTR